MLYKVYELSIVIYFIYFTKNDNRSDPNFPGPAARAHAEAAAHANMSVNIGRAVPEAIRVDIEQHPEGGEDIGVKSGELLLECRLLLRRIH